MTVAQWPHSVESELHISAEFNRSGMDYKTTQKNFKLNCPFPHGNGQDTGFHFEITKDGRKAHCWVCDWSGSWNKLAKATGLAEFNTDYGDSLPTPEKKGKLVNLTACFNDSDAADNTSLPYTISPWTQPSWRGLSSKFLSRFPTYLWSQQLQSKDGRHFTVDRILWPYNQQNRLEGYVGRRLDKKDFQKYYRAEWCSAKKILFPFDYVRKYHSDASSIVLVEGEVDALNLLQAGIPALSILGSSNWGDSKTDLIVSLNYKCVYLLMDPDSAGRKATEAISESFKGHPPYVKALHILGDDDPGSLDEGQLAWLKERVFRPAT